MVSCIFLNAQNPVDVNESTLKIGGLGEEVFYYGFAEGDKLIFNFEEVNGKELKEVEIIEMPESSKYMDYKTRKIENKTLNITKTGVYKFRFSNSAMLGRICKFKIQRVPSSDATKNFNTSVVWEEQKQVTYHNYTKDVIVGYDTTYLQKSRIVLEKTELLEEMIMQKNERVNSVNNLEYSNKRVIQVNIPQSVIEPFKEKKIISWAYWIGVGKESSEAWAKNVKAITKVTKGAATIFGGGPLAGLAVGAIGDLAMPTIGDDVAYWFITDYQNAQLFSTGQTFMQFDKGKGIAAYGKNLNRTKGTFFIGLLNDNQLQGIDVEVKISVVWETNYYKDELYTETKITPRYEKKEFSDPIINTVNVPVLSK